MDLSACSFPSFTLNKNSACQPVGPASETYLIKWWMAHYGAASAKPEKGWTNNPACQKLDLGKFDRRVLDGKDVVKTVKKTISKSGKTSYSGTAQLKSTQP